MHSHYPGFGSTYLAHHVSTFAAATAACFAGVPIGGCICFGAALEFGGMSLNIVSLWPVLNGSKAVPGWLYTARVYTFVGSRAVATIVMARTTQLSCFTPGGKQSYGALALAWTILAVNAKWVMAMVRSYCEHRISKAAGRALDGETHMRAFES